MQLVKLTQEGEANGRRSKKQTKLCFFQLQEKVKNFVVAMLKKGPQNIFIVAQ